jgi:hypothetical protein
MPPECTTDRTGLIFGSFDGNGGPLSLPDICTRLFAQQKKAWPQLSSGYDALGAVESRTIDLNGFSVQLQYNPQRITSTVAKVDPASLKKRPCFLCPKNLPAAQKGISYRREFLVLCNPFPIFNPHYTICHTQHIPQLIDESLTGFLQLAADLGPNFVVLYNGALCGASAPDHLHFQAVPAGVMPIEAALCAERKHLPIKDSEGVSVTASRSPGWSVITVEGNERAGVEVLLRRVMAAMRSVLSPSAGEPMMNLCGSYRDSRWRMIVFPRRRHRPDVYYRREEERILVSPGAADMGGLIVAPREVDFRRLDEVLIRTIFDDVSPDEDALNRIMAAL